MSLHMDQALMTDLYPNYQQSPATWLLHRLGMYWSIAQK